MEEVLEAEENVCLLWTGGWDSTFQLLQLLLIQRQAVIPYYLIDEERKSTGKEILTMKQIKELLLTSYPFVRELLKPTRFFAMQDIAPDPVVTEAFVAVNRRMFLGSQYEWFPRFCKEYKIKRLQLCVHSDDKAHCVLEQFVTEKKDGQQTIHYIDSKYKDLPEYTLFNFFTFPIFNLSKLQMAAFAEEQGWSRIMELTWFCHRPTRRFKACGICNPCLYTIEEGLGTRIPVTRRIFSYLFRVILRPMKRKIFKLC